MSSPCLQENRRPRVVYSMTTIPPRLEGMEQTVIQVIQVLKYCDKFYLNIPFISCRGKPYNISTNFLSSLSKEYRDKIEINRCEDMGPITKILPTLYKETDPETVIISMDDDIRLKQDISKILLDKHFKYPDSCVSFSGFCVGMFPFHWQFAINNKRDLECDWIQGVHTILYPRGIINVDALKHWKPFMFKHDDHRLNSFLSSQGIKRISINKSPCDFLYNDQEMARTESISGSTEFIYQNAKICYQMRKEGLYNKNHASLWITSIVGLIVFAILFAFLIIYANSFFDDKDIFFILIFVLILFIVVFVILTNSMLI